MRADSTALTEKGKHLAGKRYNGTHHSSVTLCIYARKAQHTVKPDNRRRLVGWLHEHEF